MGVCALQVPPKAMTRERGPKSRGSGSGTASVQKVPQEYGRGLDESGRTSLGKEAFNLMNFLTTWQSGRA